MVSDVTGRIKGVAECPHNYIKTRSDLHLTGPLFVCLCDCFVLVFLPIVFYGCLHQGVLLFRTHFPTDSLASVCVLCWSNSQTTVALAVMWSQWRLTIVCPKSIFVVAHPFRTGSGQRPDPRRTQHTVFCPPPLWDKKLFIWVACRNANVTYFCL